MCSTKKKSSRFICRVSRVINNITIIGFLLKEYFSLIFVLKSYKNTLKQVRFRFCSLCLFTGSKTCFLDGCGRYHRLSLLGFAFGRTR